MDTANRDTYLLDVVQELHRQWPDNRTVNIVCHGHSVPSGYMATPFVDTFHAYPHLLHVGLKERFPFAVINVIVTAIGGENSQQGAARFQRDVLNHRPSVVTIDYGLNDRGLGLAVAGEAWRAMIEQALEAGAKVLLLTPTHDRPEGYGPAFRVQDWDPLEEHARQIRDLAKQYGVGLADSYACFARSGDVESLLAWVNHPNSRGHALVAEEMLRWFPHVLPGNWQ